MSKERMHRLWTTCERRSKANASGSFPRSSCNMSVAERQAAGYSGGMCGKVVHVQALRTYASELGSTPPGSRFRMRFRITTGPLAKAFSCSEASCSRRRLMPQFRPAG